MRLALFLGLAASLAACSKTPPPEFPPVVYICPMVKDAEVLEEHAGKCPKCGMQLKPVRIVQAYSCLNNTAFIQANPGTCKTNGADLVPITASMFWVCPASPDTHELDPGKCADGSDRIQKFEPRLHGDHNPRHGGQLFMADDGWHHVEGAYPNSGLLRVFFYDDWTRPLGAEAFSARAIVKDSAGKEVGAVPLRAGRDANAMEAQIQSASLPLNTLLRVRFKEGEPEKVFDFTFNEYSKDPGAAAPVTTTQVAPLSNASNASGAKEILAEIEVQSQELAEKVEKGAPLGEYWVPALRTKDLAMVLINDHLNEIPARQRAAAENAAGRLLRAAYAIDNFADLGDRDRVLAAYSTFVPAVDDLRSAYASLR